MKYHAVLAKRTLVKLVKETLFEKTHSLYRRANKTCQETCQGKMPFGKSNLFSIFALHSYVYQKGLPEYVYFTKVTKRTTIAACIAKKPT